ncbi:unnamed protein product [Lactuca virosa]|uniref:Uncharacterized protein n=1 Tax=Lactuca virosa TaxID=75947 RepID=A0AAU9N643_9ASTR|nr:unnamed protein product [Lactuca virosa]
MFVNKNKTRLMTWIWMKINKIGKEGFFDLEQGFIAYLETVLFQKKQKNDYPGHSGSILTKLKVYRS